MSWNDRDIDSVKKMVLKEGTKRKYKRKYKKRKYKKESTKKKVLEEGSRRRNEWRALKDIEVLRGKSIGRIRTDEGGG